MHRSSEKGLLNVLCTHTHTHTKNNNKKTCKQKSDEFVIYFEIMRLFYINLTRWIWNTFLCFACALALTPSLLCRHKHHKLCQAVKCEVWNPLAFSTSEDGFAWKCTVVKVGSVAGPEQFPFAGLCGHILAQKYMGWSSEGVNNPYMYLTGCLFTFVSPKQRFSGWGSYMLEAPSRWTFCK